MAVVEPAPSFSLSPEVDEAEARAGGSSRRWRGQLGTWVPAGLIAFVLIACFLGPTLLSLPSPVGGSVLESNQPAFSPGHILGTDPNGNDILSRLLNGGQSSLWIAVAVNVLGL